MRSRCLQRWELVWVVFTLCTFGFAIQALSMLVRLASQPLPWSYAKKPAERYAKQVSLVNATGCRWWL